jgi:hypothetical protein
VTPDDVHPVDDPASGVEHPAPPEGAAADRPRREAIAGLRTAFEGMNARRPRPPYIPPGVSRSSHRVTPMFRPI